jgi:type III secretion protein V
MVINGLPRATSEIPQNRRFLRVSQPVAAGLRPLPWVSPVGGWRGVWALDPGGAVLGTEHSWDAVEFLGLHLSACLREAAPEFCDLAWVQQIFDRLDQRHHRLMQPVRARFQEEQIAAVLRGLLADGGSVATLPQILERLLEYDLLPPAGLVLDEQEMRGSLRWTMDETAPLIEYVRASLKEYLTYQQSRGTGTVPVFLIGPDLTATLRRLLRSDETGRGISDRAVVIPLLREIEQELAARSGGEMPAVLTSIDLRASLRRLLAAQQPLMRVLSYNDLTASSNISPLARLGG